MEISLPPSSCCLLKRSKSVNLFSISKSNHPMKCRTNFSCATFISGQHVNWPSPNFEFVSWVMSSLQLSKRDCTALMFAIKNTYVPERPLPCVSAVQREEMRLLRDGGFNTTPIDIAAPHHMISQQPGEGGCKYKLFVDLFLSGPHMITCSTVC